MLEKRDGAAAANTKRLLSPPQHPYPQASTECRDLSVLIHLHPQVGTFGKVQRSDSRNVRGGFWVSDLRETVRHKKNNPVLCFIHSTHILICRWDPSSEWAPTNICFHIEQFQPPHFIFSLNQCKLLHRHPRLLKSLPVFKESLAVPARVCVPAMFPLQSNRRRRRRSWKC